MTKEFWKDTALRCAWTFAEAMLGCIAIGQTFAEIAWIHALSVSGVATLACFFKQIIKYAREHTKREDDEYFMSERQTTFNEDDIPDMIEVEDYEDKDNTAE